MATACNVPVVILHMFAFFNVAHVVCQCVVAIRHSGQELSHNENVKSSAVPNRYQHFADAISKSVQLVVSVIGVVCGVCVVLSFSVLL